MIVVSTPAPPRTPIATASETIDPTEAWTGETGGRAPRYRATGVTAKAAKAQPGRATEAANNSAERGSASRASAATETAVAIAPLSRPQPNAAILICAGAREA